MSGWGKSCEKVPGGHEQMTAVVADIQNETGKSRKRYQMDRGV